MRISILSASLYLVLLLPSPGFSAVSEQQIQKDLILVAKLQMNANAAAKTVNIGEPIKLSARIRNVSRKTVYYVIKSGDGSEVGWREPYVYYTAKIDIGESTWKDVPKPRIMRCGNYDFNWQKDLVALKPGEEVSILDWIPSARTMLDLQEAGRVRLYLHYAYRAGQFDLHREPGKPAHIPKQMKRIPAFELVSAPIEFEMVRALDVVVLTKPVTPGAPTALSKVITVTIENRSRQTLEIITPTSSGSGMLSFRIEGGGERLRKNPTSVEPERRLLLKPGDRVKLFGEDQPDGADSTWVFKAGQHPRICATYCFSYPDRIGESLYLWSKWTAIPVAKPLE